MNRINPQLPNFSKIAAKIIDPSRGASTCAFGNHKWVKNIGDFTKNAAVIGIIKFRLFKSKIVIKNDLLKGIKIIIINNGREAKIVYNIK